MASCDQRESFGCGFDLPFARSDRLPCPTDICKHTNCGPEYVSAFVHTLRCFKGSVQWHGTDHTKWSTLRKALKIFLIKAHSVAFAMQDDGDTVADAVVDALKRVEAEECTDGEKHGQDGPLSQSELALLHTISTNAGAMSEFRAFLRTNTISLPASMQPSCAEAMREVWDALDHLPQSLRHQSKHGEMVLHLAAQNAIPKRKHKNAKLSHRGAKTQNPSGAFPKTQLQTQPKAQTVAERNPECRSRCSHPQHASSKHKPKPSSKRKCQNAERRKRYPVSH